MTVDEGHKGGKEGKGGDSTFGRLITDSIYKTARLITSTNLIYRLNKKKPVNTKGDFLCQGGHQRKANNNTTKWEKTNKRYFKGRMSLQWVCELGE